MSTQKIITFNPDAFKFPGKKKTLKERKTKPEQDANQALKSNKLKKELLKKVKDYQKNKEVEKIADTKAKALETQAPDLFDSNTLETSDFEREFNKSLTFLHDLSKKNKDKKKKKTLKVSNLDVHIDIPTHNLVYTSNKEPSYGCLKNGSKPTFRDLVKTKKVGEHSNRERLKIVLENNKSFDHSAFYNKYNTEEQPTCLEEPTIQEIVEPPKVQVRSQAQAQPQPQLQPQLQPQPQPQPQAHPHRQIVVMPLTNLSTNENKESNFIDLIDNKIKILNNMDTLLDSTKAQVSNEVVPNAEHGAGISSVPDIKVQEFQYNETTPIPKLCITTKTYKYKLGKNKEKRQIGVLIKNRDTQKRIKREIEKLKQEDIQTIKNYLREKGLIKLGSQAPTTILRKMYEDSILSGEINNNNSNNLVYNYLNT
jgi:hypothetical protein|uniref:Uncharacterized protein n=1 Tax=viral metagenome TaxID=1070528 RepID=A0A6C0CAZ0_9ZZZZ